VKVRVGAALFGLGVLLLVIAAGMRLYVAPAVTKLPYDLTACKNLDNQAGQPRDAEGCLKPSVAEAKNATFLQAKETGLAIRRGDLRSITEVIPRADLTAEKLTDDLKGKAVVWDVYGTVRWIDTTEPPISQYSTELALDRVSGAAADWKDQWLQDAGPTGAMEVAYRGQIYKFPFHTEKKDYEYFDRDLRQALPIRYQGTEDVGGVEAYRFQQVIPNEELNLGADRVSGLLGVFSPGASSGKVVYSNTRTVWVEPVSGSYVKVREQQRKELVPDQGTPTLLLDGDFVYTDETIANSVKAAKSNRFQINLVGLYLPIVAGILGLIALIAGLVLVIRGNGDASARHRPGGDEVDTGRDGPLTDQLPPATSNWRTDESTVPSQRPASDEAERR
jgi:hypothetical protein